ncbi:MAG: crossover junction endodeoxyribonuclease RuvC [Angelakisella sp.]
MRILGIDPGYAIVGYGVLDYKASRFSVVEYGAITTPAGMPFPKRLGIIDAEMSLLMARAKPECLAVEQLFFTNNKTTGIDVAQARGIILLAAARADVPVFEYTPPQIKQAVVGYGKAEKKQVMEMTRRLLGLATVPRPDDTADALAVAICHGHTGSSQLSKLLLAKPKR